MGSSPRARGAPGRVPGLRRVPGLIPASAGNTSTSGPRPRTRRAHPRERGEHVTAPGTISPKVGSSPRARGARRGSTGPGLAPRLIPASAGSTSPRRRSRPRWPAHPRERGEHPMLVRWFWAASGSSPRARGARRRRRGPVGGVGLIPASAGSTPSRPIRRSRQPAHPRERGEHEWSGHADEGRAGSSPRARGARVPQGRVRAQRRLIPASAGSTRYRKCLITPRRAHPRERGEHFPHHVVGAAEAGSSPRARGAHGVRASQER